MSDRMLEKSNFDDEDLEQYDRSLAKEAVRVVQDIKFGVETAEVSNILENNDSIAYINLRTLEKKDFCIELTVSGYRIVSNRFDTIDEDFLENNRLYKNTKFESYESLMNEISQLFIKKFNDSVAERLNSIE